MLYFRSNVVARVNIKAKIDSDKSNLGEGVAWF